MPCWRPPPVSSRSSWRGRSAADARRYLDKRGLAADAIARFRLGYAPNDRSALKEHLAKAGFSTAEMTASGMLITGDDIPVAYDRFRHRIIFPIADLKGRVIAFGGRALDPDAPAKYLELAGDAALPQGRHPLQRRTTPAAPPTTRPR